MKKYAIKYYLIFFFTFYKDKRKKFIVHWWREIKLFKITTLKGKVVKIYVIKV